MSVEEIQNKLPFIKEARYTYLNFLDERAKIINNLKGKPGIYCWINRCNLKYYIGSSYNLSTRINYYLYPSTLIREKRPVVSALMKYGIIHFMFVILDIIDAQTVITKKNNSI